MASRFGIQLKVPKSPPQVVLKKGDNLIVMAVHGLPRLEERHQYTDAEIASADFTFAIYTVEEYVE